MHPYKRSARVGDLIREEIADMIMNKIKHKNLGFVTVTGAKVSDDLRNATVYISVLKVEDAEKTVRKLSSLSALFRGELGRRLKMKYVPSLTFKIDESIQYGMKIDKLLNEIKSERGPHDEDEDLL
ncbi:MAG: 30S ribosome-binding factor RbfA [Nitrospirae bacterium]|nr:30S ribosome-binding factor RbfA [Nitrospirota bacterium]